MRILWVIFSYMTSEPWIESLKDLGTHEVAILRYDWPGGPPDRAIMDAVDKIAPELVIYTGTAGGENLPAPSTLAKIRKRARHVFLSGDLGDPPWWPYLAQYRAHDCFDLVVNFDGVHDWPKEGRDYTALCPIATKYFALQDPLAKRPIPFGFAGSFSWHDPTDPRRVIIDRLREDAGLRLKPYDHSYGSYQGFATFLTSCRLVPSMPFSGSGKVRQVKARVLEAALAGCCLMDHVESGARHWFEPTTDYATYEDAADAVEMARWLLANERLMQEMATRLQARVRAEHAPEIFWAKLIVEAMR